MDDRVSVVVILLFPIFAKTLHKRRMLSLLSTKPNYKKQITG